ncbi:MAG: universal stress protein [Acidobacteriaceae bacterium]
MSSPSNSSPQILFATDFSKSSQSALLCARQIARQRGASLHTIHVIDLTGGGSPQPSSFTASRESARRALRHIEHGLRLAGIPSSATIIAGGSAAHSIHEAALRYKPEILVMGSHGEPIMLAPAVGANLKAVLNRALYPVLIVNADRCTSSSLSFAPAIFVTDGDPRSFAAAVAAWPPGAQEGGVPLYWAPASGQAAPADLVAPHPAGFAPARSIAGIEAAAALLRAIASAEAGLLVIGLRSRGHLDTLGAGSLLRETITHASCPVLIVRA